MAMTDRKFGIALLTPSIILISLLFVYPICYSLYMSLHDKDPFSMEAAPFAGLEFYQSALTNPAFWIAFKNGIIYGGTTVLFQVILGVACALILNLPFAGRSVARGLVLLPYVIPTIGGTLIWKFMFNDILGVVNRSLMFLGILNEPIAWIGDTHWAMIGVITVSVWKFFPFVVICVLARLQTIPGDLYAAARVDGANFVHRFIDITIPQLKHILYVVILLRVIWMFNEFEAIYLLTGGGPVDATTTLPILAYQKAFLNFELSPAMAITIIMMVFLILSSIILFRIYRVEEEI